MRPALLLSALVLAATPAAASEILKSVETPIYEAAGSPSDLARKAVVCMGQVLKPGFTTAPTIVAQDIDGGRIVANSAFGFTDYFLIATPGEGRATVTFEAKDGRFRLVTTDIEQFSSGSWGTVLASTKKQRPDDIRSTILGISDKIAVCVKQPAADW